MTLCTVVTKSHLAGARVLAKSMKTVHPDAEVYVLLADRMDGAFDPKGEPFHLVTLQDLGNLDVIGQMSFYYNPFEFCCALRPYLHQYIWQHTAAAEWVFLDSDIFIVGDMSDVFQSLAKASVLINPHNASPSPPEFFKDLELAELQVGMFNGGFVGVRRCDEGMAFIKWFRSRLRACCFEDAPGQFVDQLWLMHVPQYFSDALIYKHPGANLAHWNLFNRTLTPAGDGRYLANGEPLMFIHFSGWDIENPTEVSVRRQIYKQLALPQLEVWKELGMRYRSALLESGHEACRQWPYAFDRFDDGTPITLEMRRKYFAELAQSKTPPQSPFARPGDFQGL